MKSRKPGCNVRILKKLRGEISGSVRHGLLGLLAAVGAAACASAPVGARGPAPFPGAPVVATRPSMAEAAAARIAAEVVETARALRGAPYRLGGADPAGFDCSGLVRYVFRQHAIDLPRTVAEQARQGATVPRDHVGAGDLVFFSTTGRGSTHVGIALDTETFIHAPDTGAVVRVERLDALYWKRRLVRIKRVTL